MIKYASNLFSSSFQVADWNVLCGTGLWCTCCLYVHLLDCTFVGLLHVTVASMALLTKHVQIKVVINIKLRGFWQNDRRNAIYQMISLFQEETCCDSFTCMYKTKVFLVYSKRGKNKEINWWMLDKHVYACVCICTCIYMLAHYTVKLRIVWFWENIHTLDLESNTRHILWQ